MVYLHFKFPQLKSCHYSDIICAMKIFHGSKSIVKERFASVADEIVNKKNSETRLKRIRSAYGCSQSRLANMSGVGLRSIQMYEQRKKNINRAEAESVLRLSRALGCEMEDILEP